MTRSMTTPKEACIETIQRIVETYKDWKLALEKRQHKFVLSLQRQSYDVGKVAEEFRYSYTEILSIFSRIERKLMQWDFYKKEQAQQHVLQQKERTRRTIEKQKEEEKKFRLLIEEEEKKWRMLMEEDRKKEDLNRKEEAKNQVRELMGGVEEPKTKQILETVLAKSVQVNVYEVFPQKLAQYIDSLLQTYSVDKTAEALSVSKNYIIQRICGRNSPRKPCEFGAIHYLEQYEEINKQAMDR